MKSNYVWVLEQSQLVMLDTKFVVINSQFVMLDTKVSKNKHTTKHKQMSVVCRDQLPVRHFVVINSQFVMLDTKVSKNKHTTKHKQMSVVCRDQLPVRHALVVGYRPPLLPPCGFFVNCATDIQS
ncbi:hypothetical protein J6590_052690 [Homalodisca vitripennis]|nr:hypothetical protein J6590_052690 [Homalodisca vitripennis]